MNYQIMDVFGIGEAIWDWTYNIFVRGPLFIVNGLGDAISYLSGPKIIDLIFGNNGHFLKIPPQFITFFAIALVLVVIFSGCVLLQAMTRQDVKGTITGLVNRVIMFVLLVILIPLFFWTINFLVTSIIKILMPQLIDGRSLADMVGRLGWTDGKQHFDWHYDVGYPDWNNYNLFLGTFGSFFCLIIFFLMGISLIKRVFDLFLLYIVSPVVLSSVASGAKWQKVNIWKDLVIGRFISSLGIVLTLTLFMKLQPLMLNVALKVSSNWVGQVSFQLLFLAGGALACYEAQLLFSALVGNTVGINDGLGMLIGGKAAIAGIKAGALGIFGVGKSLVAGKRGLIGNGNGSGVVGALKAGGIARTAGLATKATVGATLTAAGFIAGVGSSVRNYGIKGTAKRAVKSGITNPATKLGKVVQSKVNASYQKGAGKHTAHQLKSQFKQELKNPIKQPYTPGAQEKAIIGSSKANKTIIMGTKEGKRVHRPHDQTHEKMVDFFFDGNKNNWYAHDSKNHRKDKKK